MQTRQFDSVDLPQEVSRSTEQTDCASRIEQHGTTHAHLHTHRYRHTHTMRKHVREHTHRYTNRTHARTHKRTHTREHTHKRTHTIEHTQIEHTRRDTHTKREAYSARSQQRRCGCGCLWLKRGQQRNARLQHDACAHGVVEGILHCVCMYVCVGERENVCVRENMKPNEHNTHEHTHTQRHTHTQSTFTHTHNPSTHIPRSMVVGCAGKPAL